MGRSVVRVALSTGCRTVRHAIPASTPDPDKSHLALPRGARARGAGMRRVRELLRGARALVAEVE